MHGPIHDGQNVMGSNVPCVSLIDSIDEGGPQAGTVPGSSLWGLECGQSSPLWWPNAVIEDGRVVHSLHDNGR